MFIVENEQGYQLFYSEGKMHTRAFFRKVDGWTKVLVQEALLLLGLDRW